MNILERLREIIILKFPDISEEELDIRMQLGAEMLKYIIKGK